MSGPRRTARLAVVGALVAASAVAGVGADALETGPSAHHLAAAVTPPAVTADVDGDRLADDLEADVLAASPLATFDVIARTASGDPAAAVRAVGAFPVSTELPLIDGFAASLTAAQILALAADPDTVRIDGDGVVRLTDDGGRADFGADRAQADLGVTGAGVGICVIDSGVDPLHEQLDDGKVVGWIDLINGLPTPYDDHNGGVGGHGTHVSAIAAGDGAGASPLADQHRGVAPGADLYVAKAFEGTLPDDIPIISPTQGQESVTIAGIQWCVDQPGVDILSMSFTKTGPTDGADALGAAVTAAVAAGKIAVAAAGNDGPNPGLLGSPGASPSAITVGAVAEWSLPVTAPNRSEGPFLPAFSSRGPTLDGRIKPDVVAPGHTVLSASSGTAVGYVEKSGTSMATPFTSGALALALEADPTLDHAALAALVEVTAIDRGATGKDIDFGAGMIDVGALVARAAGQTVVVPQAFPTHTVLTGTTVGGPWTHTFELGPGDLSVPIAATILIDGGPDLTGAFWDPDLQATLHDPLGTQLDLSDCPLLTDPNDCLGNSTAAGRQELVHALPTVAGTYTLTVADTEFVLGSGSGSFLVDLSHGPVPAPPTAGPCTTTFTGDGDGTSWSDPTNWSGPLTPLPLDVACIPVDEDVVHDPSSTTVEAVLVDGALTVPTATTLSLLGITTASTVAGTLDLGAGGSVESGTELALTGVLAGRGTLIGDLANDGEVRPAGIGSGTLTIDGSYRQGPAGTLAVVVATPTVHDRLVVTGAVTLDGTLAIGTNYPPAIGDDVEIIDAGTATWGTFASVTGAALGGSRHWEVDTTSDVPDVHLVVVEDPVPAGQERICHKVGTKAERTMVLSAGAAAAHRRAHGDHDGPC